jgi:hypothetical protein
MTIWTHQPPELAEPWILGTSPRMTTLTAEEIL